ncbi:hypothetical protein DF182_22520 [Chitinophaga flava]|uniref:Uncharacterized protein n=2 Tax=Chitinophaga flava TaxID=2259036 RepID=A0A365XSG8_9BACT|nr:hypothetical protein DF182_22520 [Chitinophaga flava]
MLNACRKVDEHKTLVESQPWLADHYSLSGRYGISQWNYPSTWVVGDTGILIGKFFLEKPGSEIRVGGVPVKLVDHIQLDPNNQYTTDIHLETVDVARFIITKEMGIGPGRPITITANGITINGAPLSIQDFAESVGRTDTTLLVDKLAHWVPANASVLNQKGYAFVRSIHCDRNGNIWFDNQLSINEVTNGQVNSILNAGDKLTDANGVTMTIKEVLGSAISFDGNTLFFSIEDGEPSADAADNYIFRLCKMDVPTKNITMLNRTLVQKKVAPFKGDASPFQGSVDRMKIVAMYLNTDLRDNLTYTNYYAPPSTTDNHAGWKSDISSGTINMEVTRGNLVLISRLDVAGKVTPLMNAPYFGSNRPAITGPGIHVASSFCFVDPSGKYVYGMANVESWRTLIVKYDVQQEDIIASARSIDGIFAFHSYDSAQATRGAGPMDLGVIDWSSMGYYFNSSMVISDGSILAVYGGSLYNYDFEQRTVYCYAGVENALSGPAPGQDKLTGKAKWVDFSNAALIGQDKSNAVYYCQGAMTTDGIDFYKLHSPGK